MPEDQLERQENNLPSYVLLRDIKKILTEIYRKTGEATHKSDPEIRAGATLVRMKRTFAETEQPELIGKVYDSRIAEEVETIRREGIDLLKKAERKEDLSNGGELSKVYLTQFEINSLKESLGFDSPASV